MVRALLCVCALGVSVLFGAGSVLAADVPEWSADDAGKISSQNFLIMASKAGCNPCNQAKKWYNSAFGDQMMKRGGENAVACRLVYPEKTGAVMPANFPEVAGFPTFVFRKKGSDTNWAVNNDVVEEKDVSNWVEEELKNFRLRMNIFLLPLFGFIISLVTAKVYLPGELKDGDALKKDWAIICVQRPSCGHCKNIGYFDELSGEDNNSHIDFVKLDSSDKDKFSKYKKIFGLEKAPHIGATPMFYLVKKVEKNSLKDKVKGALNPNVPVTYSLIDEEKMVGTGNIKAEGLKTILENAK